MNSRVLDVDTLKADFIVIYDMMEDTSIENGEHVEAEDNALENGYRENHETRELDNNAEVASENGFRPNRKEVQ